MPARWLATREVALSELARFPGNARRGNVGEIRRSLRRHGQYRAIVVRQCPDGTRVILAGNHTADALQAEGRETARCELIECDDDEARRINLSDNRLGELPDPETGERYDGDELAGLLASLDGDYDGTGWTAEDLAALLDDDPPEPAGGGDPEGSPEPPEEPRSAPGDLLILGPHRLLCGDATNPDDIDRATDGLGEVGIVYTDPPYGISIVKGRSVGGAKPFGTFGAAQKQVHLGTIGSGKVVPTTRYMPVTGDDSTATAADAFRLLFAEYPAALHVWWGGNHYAASAGLADSSCWLVWDKQNGDNNFADAELAWTNHPGAVRLLRHMWNGMLRASERGKRVHPNQKPAALHVLAFGVVDPKAERKVVLDVFGGSGSTLIAAHRTGRAAAIVEMEPAYVDIIAARFEAETGITPERVLPDGATEPVTFT